MNRTFSRHGGYSKPINRGVRSGSEERVLKQIERAGYSYTYEGYKIPYIVPASNHTYTPDILLTNGIIVEVKGLFEAEDRQKMLRIKEQYPHLDIRFVFDNFNNRLYKGSPTTYAKWCEKYGFPYASKLIPDSWFKENHKDTTGLIPKKGK